MRLGWMLAAWMAWTAHAWAQPVPAATNQSPPKDDHELARRGVDLMLDGDLTGAKQAFRQIQHESPDSALGFVLEADVTWWEIYYDTANLIDPDVFDVSNKEATQFDSHFNDVLNVGIHKAEAQLHAHQDDARNYLYEGFAYALRARMEGLHDRDLPTARAGKKMRTLLLHAVALDPSLTDAYLGLGIYNYFVDTLSAIVKLLSVFIGLPGGSRTEGLRQLQLCANKGELARGEAKFYLAKDYSRASEKQFAKAQQLFGELQQEYPHNPLWPMLVASLDFRLGKPQRGEARYREVLENTAKGTSDVQAAVHRAAQEALRRLHPEQ